VLDKVTKAAAVAALLFYISGVLTVSVYLFSLDAPVPDLQALKPRYVLTGAIVVVGMSLATAWWLGIARTFAGKGSPAPVAKLALAVLGFAAGVGVWAVVLAFDDPASVISRVDDALGVWALTLAAAIPFAVGAGLVLLADFGHEWLFAGALLGGLITAVVFACFAYEKVPDQFGGGRPSQALLLFKAADVEAAKALGVRFPSKGSLLSSPVTLLYDSDKFIVMRVLPSEQVVQLDRALVFGTRRDSHGPRMRDVQTVDAGGTRGLVQQGDMIVFTYTEIVDAASIIGDWDGTSREVTATLEPRGDREAVLKLDDDVHLGSVELDFEGDHEEVGEPVTFPGSHIAQEGNAVFVTLGRSTAGDVSLDWPTTLRWRPGTVQVSDLAGNAASTDDLAERSHAGAAASDVEF
jgi:hypothetical protein